MSVYLVLGGLFAQFVSCHHFFPLACLELRLCPGRPPTPLGFLFFVSFSRPQVVSDAAYKALGRFYYVNT